MSTARSKDLAGPPVRAWSIWITRIALGLAIALVAARATMPEVLRDPIEIVPHSEPAPRGLGAAGGVVLDLLMCVPALLVLLRSSIDRDYLISFSRSHVLAFALSAWIVISTFWASDRFAAAIEATHWGAAIVLLWATAQLVESWTRLRLIAAAGFGLLLILIAHGAVYRFVDFPDERQSFLQNEQKIYRDRGWAPDSFIAQQFKKKVLSAEVLGFSTSPNTYAMMLVLTGMVATGLALQRISDRDEWGWPTTILLAIPPALLMLWLTRCRAAFVTPVIGAGLIAAAATWAGHRSLPAAWLADLHRRAYFLALIAIGIIVALVLGYGLSHGSLVHDSLTFRWRYWVGAMRLVRQHPIFGVGFANFGPHYLSVRLPIASEEIQDPHNFFVRILTETGIVGAALLVCWMLALWWEMTLPQTLDESQRRPSPLPLIAAFALALAAMLINTLAGVDFTIIAAWVQLELLKRILWLGLLFGGIVIGTMRASNRQQLDDRMAPWILWTILAALGVFLLHNTIEFGLFESGPLGVFALLCGAALGIRGTGSRFGSTWYLTAIAAVFWLVMAGCWVAPVVYAESKAQAGDAQLEGASPDPAAAAADYRAAFTGLPLWNGDYAMHMALALAYANAPSQQVIDSLDAALGADPMLLRGYLTRAQFRLSLPSPNLQLIKSDYQTAIALNPNDVDVRCEYAGILEHFGAATEAADQYRAALAKNAGLSPDEPKRLTEKRVREIQDRLTALTGH